MGEKRYERQCVLVKEETSKGVDASPTGADNAIPYEEPVSPDYDAQEVERNNPLNSLSPIPNLIGKKSIKLGFKTAFYGSGSLGTAPRIGDMLEMCGFGETVNASTSVVYAPISEDLKTATIYQYIDGLLYKALGAVGSLKISGKVGEPIYFETEAQGLYQDDSDTSIVTPEYGTNYNTPPQMLGVTFSFDSVTTFLLREFNIDMGQEPIPREDAGESHGFAGFMLSKRKPSGNIIIELESKATYDFMAKMEAATKLSAYIETAANEGNKLKIDMNFTIGAPKIEDAGGLAILNIPIKLCQDADAGNDEIELTVT
jgi:hypothetical protein